MPWIFVHCNVYTVVLNLETTSSKLSRESTELNKFCEKTIRRYADVKESEYSSNENRNKCSTNGNKFLKTSLVDFFLLYGCVKTSVKWDENMHTSR